MAHPAIAASCLLGLLFVAGTADAACYAEYKARRGDPLQLHYGILRLSDAECSAPARAVARRIRRDGWTLLAVMGLLSQAEAEQRRSDAGAYYLRY